MDEKSNSEVSRKSKFRGFRNKDHTTTETLQSNNTIMLENGSRQQDKSNLIKRVKISSQSDVQPPSSNNVDSAQHDSAIPQHQASDRPSKKQYCHFFSNFGKCRYEERTENPCRFLHDPAVPMCNSGISCTRTKCMYKHPRIGGKPSFLGNNPNPVNINPWQMLLPWLNTMQSAGQNIWTAGQHPNPQN